MPHYREEAPTHRYKQPPTVESIHERFRSDLKNDYGLDCGDLYQRHHKYDDDTQYFRVGPYYARIHLERTRLFAYVLMGVTLDSNWTQVWGAQGWLLNREFSDIDRSIDLFIERTT